MDGAEMMPDMNDVNRHSWLLYAADVHRISQVNDLACGYPIGSTLTGIKTMLGLDVFIQQARKLSDAVESLKNAMIAVKQEPISGPDERNKKEWRREIRQKRRRGKL